MTHCYMLKAVEHSLYDIYERNRAFGGKMVISEVISGKYFWLGPRGADHILLHLQYQGHYFGAITMFNILGSTCNSCIQI